MDLEALQQFLIAANKAGYASGGESQAVTEDDSSKSIIFEQGEFASHDNWFGGEPYGGRNVVFYQNQPAWMMVYYGTVDPAFEDLDGVYTFLRNALMQQSEDMPLRGPKKLEDGAWRYENNWEGDLGIFSGEEIIYFEDKPIYDASYSGGFVDVRKE